MDTVNIGPSRGGRQSRWDHASPYLPPDVEVAALSVPISALSIREGKTMHLSGSFFSSDIQAENRFASSALICISSAILLPFYYGGQKIKNKNHQIFKTSPRAASLQRVELPKGTDNLFYVVNQATQTHSFFFF